MAGSCPPVFDRAIGPAASAIPVAGKATHLIPSTSRDLGRLRRLITTDIDLVQSSRSAITVTDISRELRQQWIGGRRAAAQAHAAHPHLPGRSVMPGALRNRGPIGVTWVSTLCR
jgi:hypothetical protein